MDATVMFWIHRHASPALDAAFVLSASLGSFSLWVPLTLLVTVWLLRRRQYREAVAWLVLAALVGVSTELLKRAVGRPRPTLWPWLLTVSDSSFPSGHSLAAAAFYPFLGFLALRARKLGGVGYGLGLAIAAFVGVGRMYVGVHWPSDVLGGWALGMALSGTSVWWLTRPTDRR